MAGSATVKRSRMSNDLQLPISFRYESSEEKKRFFTTQLGLAGVSHDLFCFVPVAMHFELAVFTTISPFSVVRQ